VKTIRGEQHHTARPFTSGIHMNCAVCLALSDNTHNPSLYLRGC
jgi:hypothetical protein